MSNEKIRDLLTELHGEFQKTDVDPSTRSLIRELDADIHKLLDPDTPETDSNSIVGRARQLEADFATSHPVAERMLREIVETLARMGV